VRKSSHLIKNIKQEFKENGFVKVENLVSKFEIKLIKKDINHISKILKEKKYKHLHLTEDGKINSIHDINKLKIKSYLKKFAKKKN
tara:strand:+ start:1511 stop:1768 length:258 start_codon:yes stop_codon:yes gene_type:complete